MSHGILGYPRLLTALISTVISMLIMVVSVCIVQLWHLSINLFAMHYPVFLWMIWKIMWGQREIIKEVKYKCYVKYKMNAIKVMVDKAVTTAFDRLTSTTGLYTINIERLAMSLSFTEVIVEILCSCMSLACVCL